MAEVIGVRFKEVGKIYYFDPDGQELKKGDRVIVETVRGVECGEVALENREISDEEIVKPLKKLIRKADEKDLRTLEENKKKFALDHMRIIAGTAPEAMEELPAPTHAFIGGSSGNMKEIVELLLEKNPQVRMVINCITLETVGETLSCIKEMQTERSEWKWESEVVQLGVSRSKEIGRYHMMMGENPIYIITIQAHKKENFV